MIILTDDERTVLMIADKGELMIPIGRWEQPVEHLVKLGYLQCHDKFNNTITEAGRVALNDEQDIVDDNFAKAFIKANNAVVIVNSLQNISVELVKWAKEVAEETACEPLVALQKCVAAVRDRAIDLLK